MKNPVAWFEIYVQNMRRAQKFYESVLQVELSDLIVPAEDDTSESFHMVSFPFDENKPNISGALIQAEGIPSGGNSTVVYFTCDDCAVEESRVAPSGGRVLKPKFSLGPFGFCTICLDTEGNTFGLHSME